MLPFVTLATALLPDGPLHLQRSGAGVFRLALGGRTLMKSDEHASEEALAAVTLRALAPAAPPARVLVAGLGMGFTLRAALDALPPRAEVHVVELVPEVIEWCRGPLAPLSRDALADARVRLHVKDVLDLLAAPPTRFDALLLDVDNGPHWETQRRNQLLYTEVGLRQLRTALRAGGRLAIWSAAREVAGFQRRLERAGFAVETHAAPARAGGRSRHLLYVASLRSLTSRP